MRTFYDFGALFGGGSGSSNQLNLASARTVNPEAAKTREQTQRQNADALALFKVQEAGFGGSERGTLRAGTSLSVARGETARTGPDRPGENTTPTGPSVRPPGAPEIVPISPLSTVIGPPPSRPAGPATPATPPPVIKIQSFEEAIRKFGGNEAARRLVAGQFKIVEGPGAGGR